MTSAMRPMAWESEESMLIAPRSWSKSSAAMVPARMRGAAKAGSSAALGADGGVGEGEILGDLGIEVVANHEHVEMLVHGVDGERHGGVGRRGEAVGLATDLDDVGGVPAARALRVVGVDGPALERADRVLDEARLVQG